MPMYSLFLQYSATASFTLITTFSVTEILPQKDSSKCQVLHLHCQFSFTKILKALHTGLNIYSILEERPKLLLKMFLIDADRLTLLRCPKDIILKHKSKHLFFSILTTDNHIDMQVNMWREKRKKFYIYIKFLRGVQRMCEKCPQVTSTICSSTEVPRTSI